MLKDGNWEDLWGLYGGRRDIHTLSLLRELELDF